MDSKRDDSERADGGTDATTAPDVVGFVLGEGSPGQRERVRTALALDLDLALDVADTRALLDDLRTLRATPTGQVVKALEREVLWRQRLRGRDPAAEPRRLVIWLRVAAVALIWLAISDRVFRSRPPSPSNVPPGTGMRLAQLLDVPAGGLGPSAAALAHALRAPVQWPQLALPVDSAEFVAAWQRVIARPLPSDFVDWLAAENVLSRARAAVQRRSVPELRTRWRQRTGAADVEARVQCLAAELAQRTAAELESAAPDLEQVAVALRALLASGAGPHHGVHAPLVRACRAELVGRVDGAEFGVGVVVLAALAELAVDDTDALGAFVATRADALIASLVTAPVDGRRPPLLRWGAPVHHLAEASRLLTLAPAFGADADGALRARMLLVAHLEERAERLRGFEAPELHAALRYGFADLIDLAESDRQLALWSPRLLVPDYRALAQFTWGSYPIRRGWADLQRELLGLTGLRTPPRLADAASLLLALCSDAMASDPRAPTSRALSG